jgi:hypothetical protein
MGYKTEDLYELNEGDKCFVSIQCLTGDKHLSPMPRPAVYMDDYAKLMGHDFTFKRPLRSRSAVCDGCSCEIIGVWKFKPKQK